MIYDKACPLCGHELLMEREGSFWWGKYRLSCSRSGCTNSLKAGWYGSYRESFCHARKPAPSS